MAEERIQIAVTPEITKPRDKNLRNSTGRTNSSNSGEKVLPHYLRASTNSCHDFCKYGRKHAFEAKRKQPILIRITATPAKSQNPVKTETPVQKNMKAEIKLKPSPEPETKVPDKLKIVKRVTKIFNKEASSPSKKMDVGSKPAIALKPKPVAAKSSLSPLNAPEGLRGRRNSDIKIINNSRTSKIVEKKASVPPIASLSPKPSVNRISSSNTSKYMMLKASSTLKNQNKVRKAEPMLSNDDKFKEKMHVIEPKPEKRNLGPSPKVREAASPVKNQNMVRKVEPMLLNDDKFEEKTRVIEPKPENRSLGPTQNGTLTSQSSPSSSSVSSSPPSSPSLSSDEEEEQEECESTLSEENISISDDDETKNDNQIKTLKEEYKRSRRTAMVHPEDKVAPHKLNFRRGRVVNLQAENNGPKRLRFRQGRVWDNQNGKGDIGRRSFRRRREVGDADTNGTKDNSGKVVLRHQDVQGKKGDQGLFNNVIEETASKLVETRKSKVKALVGAFETVISLQETKPSASGTA